MAAASGSVGLCGMRASFKACLQICRLLTVPPCLLAAPQVKEEGFEVAHGGYCVTIFSAPNYCDQMVRGRAMAVACQPRLRRARAAPPGSLSKQQGCATQSVRVAGIAYGR